MSTTDPSAVSFPNDAPSKLPRGAEADRKQVAMIIETSSAYGRDLISGITRHMRIRDNWSVFLEQGDLPQSPPHWLGDWRGDGIISRATTPKLIEALERTGVPLVELTDRREGSTLPQVRSDDAAIGRIGAEHLIERGFQRFGFCGFTNEAWSRRRKESFRDAVCDHSIAECQVYESAWYGPTVSSWEEEQSRLIQWLQQMKPPFAIMACNDIRGKHVLNACSWLQYAVPEQVAVLGVDNDDLLCRMCSPPLTSVIPSAEMVGFKAAELLDRLMNHQAAECEVELVKPMGIATRQSTDVVAIENRTIASALQYIRQHACRGITVDEVVEKNDVSRSTLERQIRKHLGRTPQEEIRHVQVKRVTELLAMTDFSAAKIATSCGFENPEYMFVVFKRITGLTPGQFRRQAKP